MGRVGDTLCGKRLLLCGFPLLGLALILGLAWAWPRREQPATQRRAEPSTPAIAVHFQNSNGDSVAVAVDPDDPLPALLQLSDHIAELCEPVRGGSPEAPVALGRIEARFGSLTPRMMNAGLQKAVSESPQARGSRRVEVCVQTTFQPTDLCQGGPNRFGWMQGTDGGFSPIGGLCSDIPHATVSVPHSTQWLASYFAEMLASYHTWNCVFGGGADPDGSEELEERLRAAKPGLARQWAQRIREHHGLTTVGRWVPNGSLTPDPGPAPASRQ